MSFTMSAIIDVTLIAAVVSLASVAFQKKMVNQDRVDEIKKKMKEYNKKYKKALKENDKNALKKLEAEGKEVTQMSMELMKYSLKPTMYTLVPILAVIAFIKSAYGDNPIISIPLVGGITPFWWYVIIATVVGLLSEAAYTAYRRNKNGRTRKKD